MKLAWYLKKKKRRLLRLENDWILESKVKLHDIFHEKGYGFWLKILDIFIELS